jgi:hypothetical protein
MGEIRKGQGDVKLTRDEFARRLRERFYDPAFESLRAEIDHLVDVAWTAYDEYHKSPRKRKAGPGFADPEYELPVEWLEAREAVLGAERRNRDPAARSRILLICGAARHDQTCPGEMSKTFRLIQIAREIVDASDGFESDLLDLSHLTAEYGRQILPCKACVSTAMPLSRHGSGQRLDERDLSALGGRPRDSDHLPGVLVSGAKRAQVDDRSPRVRRWR